MNLMTQRLQALLDAGQEITLRHVTLDGAALDAEQAAIAGEHLLHTVELGTRRHGLRPCHAKGEGLRENRWKSFRSGWTQPRPRSRGETSSRG